MCPACNARRMVATAAHITDHVLPDLPLRQWVLAVPKRLRYFLERDAERLTFFAVGCSRQFKFIKR